VSNLRRQPGRAGTPAGGGYSGNGVVFGNFNAADAGVGTHAITYTYFDGNGCENSAVQLIGVDACASLEELNENALVIYPNPAQSTFTLESEFLVEQLEIVDISGKVVRLFDKNTVVYDVNSLNSGTYFVRVQTDAAVRKLASMYPYDNFADEGHDEDITLRSSVNEVSSALEKELEERLAIAGIEVLEARIGYLAYAQEIANAMLKRQQATAIVAARHKIVEGAVSMVEMALNELSKKQIIDLDDERKAAMVSNLMVILCGDKDASPVLNTGTLNT